MTTGYDETAPPRSHDWTGVPLGEIDGDWQCLHCGSVCDHREPCNRHGACHGPISLWERLRSTLPWWAR